MIAASILIVSAGIAKAGTSAADAKQLDAARSKGLASALIAHVEKAEPRACAPADDELQEVTATRIAGGGTVDYVEADQQGKRIPRTYWEDYTAHFLVVHECYYGSTKVGSWVQPQRAGVWKVSYKQQRPDPTAKRGKSYPRSQLSIVRVQDVTLPKPF